MSDSPSGTDGTLVPDGPQETGADVTTDSPSDDVSSSETGPDGTVPVDGGKDSGSSAEGGPDAHVEAATPDASCSTSSVTSYCSTIPPLPAAPVIDGVLDCGPPLLPMMPTSWNGTGTLPAGNSASIAMAYRPNGLYVFVQVVTPVAIPADSGQPPFDGAGAEIFLDSDGVFTGGTNYDNPGALQMIAEAPGASSPTKIADGYRNAVLQGAWTTQYGTYKTATGFVLEAFVVGSDLGLASWSLASNGKIGFDISVDVSFTDTTTMSAQGHRNGQYFLFVGGGQIYNDPRSMCVPQLQ
jgi:hypothetical protein